MNWTLMNKKDSFSPFFSRALLPNSWDLRKDSTRKSLLTLSWINLIRTIKNFFFMLPSTWFWMNFSTLRRLIKRVKENSLNLSDDWRKLVFFSSYSTCFIGFCASFGVFWEFQKSHENISHLTLWLIDLSWNFWRFYWSFERGA